MKTYQCCFCTKKFNRDKLADHIESEHDDQVPHDLTPYQLAYDIINDHPDHHGKCSICGKDTNWNHKTNKYHRICKDPKCYEAVKKTYQERMLKVYNKLYLTDDPEHQKKMLEGRRISGKYKWSDGKIFSYVGSYEKRFLEFLDKVLEYDSQDIITPGPVLEYHDEHGKLRHWITDCLILPYNLLIEVKDGGNNPNNKIDFESRQKQLAKEKVITSQGKYSYLRLTNNDFGQLLSCLAELKMQSLDDNSNPIFRIHEDEFFEASRLNDYSVLAESELVDMINENKIISSDIFKIEGIFLDESDENNEIFSIAALFPKPDLIYEFVEYIPYLPDMLNESHENDRWRFKGFFINESNPLDGYLLGIEILD